MAQKDYHGPLSPIKHNMLRRMPNWDYQGRCIYMVTLAISGRRPLLGRLEGDILAKEGSVNYPHLVPSALGEAVAAGVMEISSFCPQIEVIGYQLMPDHLHIILFVHEEMPKHLGKVIGGFKSGCTKQYRALMHATDSMWESLYHDRVLLQQGQLQTMLRYLKQNPYRLMVKRSNPDWFHQLQAITVGPYSFQAIGNRWLLERPDLIQVQCSRRITPDALASYQKEILAQAAAGAVLVSPCISPGEQQTMRRAREEGYAIIVLLENGFAPLYKPQGHYFEACAAGKLLMLAPWPYHMEKRAITREQCLALNAMAQVICER